MKINKIKILIILMENIKLNISNEKDDIKLPISKSALKKIKKREEWLKKKEELKEKRKEKKLELKKKKNDEKLNTPKPEKDPNIHYMSKEEKQNILKEKIKKGTKIIIDLDYENLMDDKSINSMARQIERMYSLNRKLENPYNLILYNLDTNITKYLEKANYKQWVGLTIYKKGDFDNFDSFLKSILSINDDSLNKIKQNNVFYLSADSNNVIDNFNNDCVYIIGGLVDRNKYKLISFNKANDLGINHIKFPIDNYVHLHTSQVLTTNQTFELIAKYEETKSWKDALLQVIPKRKMDN